MEPGSKRRANRQTLWIQTLSEKVSNPLYHSPNISNQGTWIHRERESDWDSMAFYGQKDAKMDVGVGERKGFTRKITPNSNPIAMVHALSKSLGWAMSIYFQCQAMVLERLWDMNWTDSQQVLRMHFRGILISRRARWKKLDPECVLEVGFWRWVSNGLVCFNDASA